jgi:regulator of protease activity HflC (stomatin/prohibitin superfamily)
MSLSLIQVAGFGSIIVLVAVVLFVIFLVASAVRIVKEYERGVIFRLGRVQGTAKGPGLFFLVPIVDRMVKIDLRTVTMDVPPQDLITRDNVPARVNAVVYFRVIDPNKSVIEVENHVLATSQISQTTLRSVLGQKDLDDLLTDRESINEQLQSIIDMQTDPWGVKVSVVEVKDVEIPQGMQRSMAGQAQAERERRAKIISAEGEYQASQRLHDAAERLESPTALQLRLFQTLTEISSEQSSTVILPVPMDLFRPYLGGSTVAGAVRDRQAPAEGRSSREEEGEAERLYEEAVGQASSEQQALRDLDPEGKNGRAARSIEDEREQGEKQPPSGEEPPRLGSS